MTTLCANSRFFFNFESWALRIRSSHKNAKVGDADNPHLAMVAMLTLVACKARESLNDGTIC